MYMYVLGGNVVLPLSSITGRERFSCQLSVFRGLCILEKCSLKIHFLEKAFLDDSDGGGWKRRRPASDGYRPREDEGSIWYLTEPLPTIIRPDQTARAVVSKANLENLQLSLSYKLCRVSTSIISQLCYKHLGDKSQNSACHSARPRRALRSGIHLNPEPAQQQHLNFAPCCEQQ